MANEPYIPARVLIGGPGVRLLDSLGVYRCDRCNEPTLRLIERAGHYVVVGSCRCAGEAK